MTGNGGRGRHRIVPERQRMAKGMTRGTDRSVRTKIVQMGDSRGVRIPKTLIEEARLGENIRLRVVASGILIERGSPVRAGWAEAAARLRSQGDDQLLDEALPSDFDQEEWDWE